jgi:hypothetical protein
MDSVGALRIGHGRSFGDPARAVKAKDLAAPALCCAAMRWIVGVVLGLAFAGLMVWAVLQEGRVQCEVCLDYGGASACRTGSGIDREAAVQGAVYNACAILSGGVTEGIECASTRPRSVECGD